MPDWREILERIDSAGRAAARILDDVRREYLKQLYDHTGRNVIIYYSAWMQKPSARLVSVCDEDKIGFMTAVHNLDGSRGLDLILHTPGGDLAATESHVTYLKSIFGNNMRAIVPQLAMSAGTLMACACREIVMGKQSSLGPVDPQKDFSSATGVLEEFERAKREITHAIQRWDDTSVPSSEKVHPQAVVECWNPILSKYTPGRIIACERAIEWSKEILRDWLKENMLSKYPKSVRKVVEALNDYEKRKAHNRHLSITNCSKIGLKVVPLENDGILQDLVLSVHHATIHTFSKSLAVRLIENQNGIAFIKSEGSAPQAQ